MRNSRRRSNIVPLSLDPRAGNALKYRVEFCEQVKDMARTGAFPEQWCLELDISLSTMYNWANRYPEFDEACQLAWTFLTAYWTRQTVKAANGEPANTKVLIHLLQKRFPDTWGHSARNTHASFPHKAGLSDPADSGKDERRYSDMTSDEIRAELAKLRKSELAER